MKSIKTAILLSVTIALMGCDATTGKSPLTIKGSIVKAEQAPVTTISSTYYFDLNRSKLSQSAKDELNLMIDALEKNPNAKVRVEGHADQTGSERRNLALSKRRANAIVSYLTSNGIALNRIQVAAFGSSKLVVNSRDELALAKNRRAVVTIDDEKGLA